MNSELLSLIRETGYLTDATLTDQQRFDLLTPSFWRRARVLGYDLLDLRRMLWRTAGRPESFLLSQLPLSEIEKAVRSKSKEEDPRKRIKETAAAIALLYKRGEKEIRLAIDSNLDNPVKMRMETNRIRRGLLYQAANWLGVAMPGLYLAGSRVGSLQGPHEKAARAMIVQEYNRFKEADAQLGRHIEEVIAESERRRSKASLSQTQVDYTGLKGRVVGHKTIDGKELGLADYIAMVALTAAREVFNEGVQNAMIGRGSDLALISREVRANSCQACRDWAGKIVSISGKNDKYPSLQDAKDAKIFHPHCIHFLEDIEEGRYAGTGHYIGGVQTSKLPMLGGRAV
jgi:hypothetical protein